MKMWISYVEDLYALFDPDLHCDEAFDDFSFRMSVTLGQIATIDVEREQTGWSLVATGQPRNVLVSESLTGDPADAYVRARARIVGLPSDLLGPTQSITGICAPADINERLLAFCKAHLSAGPETDFLFTDASPGDVESYLLARSGNLQVDPATHDISFIDDIEPAVVHDMAAVALYEGGRPADGPGLYDPPSKTYRAELTASWFQNASGTTDIRGFFPGGIETLDSGFAGRIASSLSAEGSEGWSVGAVRLATTVGETLPQAIGSIYTSSEIRTEILTAFLPGTNPTNDPRNIVAQRAPDPDGTGNPGQQQPDGNEVEILPMFRNFRHSVRQFEMNYVYSQGRSERAYLALDMPVQESVLVRDEPPEPHQFAIGDIFSDPGIEEWETDRDYALDERVRHGDGYYRAVAAHHSTFFDEDRGIRVEEPIYIDGEPVDGLVRFTTTFWMRTFPDDIPTSIGMTSFLETPRGQACVQHALLRLRKEARRGLLVRHITSEYHWADAAHVDMADGLSLVVSYDGGTTGRRVSGKVVTMEYAWDGESAIISAEIAVPFGTGLAAAPPVAQGWADEWADDYTGSAATALAQIDYEVVADPPKGSVDPRRLFSPTYSCLSATVENQTLTQLAALDETIAAKADPTEVSVRVPTYATVRMRSLASQELPERELDVVATMLTSPSGINLYEAPLP